MSQNFTLRNKWEHTQNFEEAGSFPQANAECGQQWRGEGDVLAAVQQSPSTCIRSGIAQTQVWRILHHDGLYPYHLQRVQHLLPGDHATRVRYCEWLQPRLHNLHDILFTDEAQFTRDVTTNTRNSHSWAYENSREVAECHFQHWFSVNMWRGVLANNLIGPHVIEGHFTALYYRNFLEN
jgi:hypothetical protein